MTGIFLYLKHVAGLLDRCYEREALLHANHIHSFAPLLRFDEQLAANAQEVVEHREYHRISCRGYLWPNRDAAAASMRMRDEANVRALESGNSWEGQPTAYMRRRMKMAIQQREHFNQMRLPYEDERAALFEEVTILFDSALHGGRLARAEEYGLLQSGLRFPRGSDRTDAGSKTVQQGVAHVLQGPCAELEGLDPHRWQKPEPAVRRQLKQP